MSISFYNREHGDGKALGAFAVTSRNFIAKGVFAANHADRTYVSHLPSDVTRTLEY